MVTSMLTGAEYHILGGLEPGIAASLTALKPQIQSQSASQTLPYTQQERPSLMSLRIW